jgi:hypothetical protein
MNKKLIGLLFVTVFILVTGCIRVQDRGLYKEGTYFSFDAATKYSVVMYVGSDGMIKSVLFDAAYAAGCAQRGKLDDTCTITTKRALGDNYNMRVASPISKEWYEQVDAFAAKVVAAQGIDWLEFKYRVLGEDGKYTFTAERPAEQEEDRKVFTDSVSGVTIIADNLQRLVSDVLEQAKK